MVYKKYIKRDGKSYGPYYYKNTREGGKVITSYIAKTGKSGRIIILSSILVIILSLLFIGYKVSLEKDFSLRDSLERFKELPLFNSYNVRLSPVDSCMNIISSGDYDLTNNLYANGVTCINITVSNVKLNGQGFSIIGNNALTGHGIFVAPNINNINITNIGVSQFVNGLHIYSGARHFIYNNNFSGNNKNGIYSFSSSDSIISNNIIAYNVNDNLYLQTYLGKNNKILYNYIAYSIT